MTPISTSKAAEDETPLPRGHVGGTCRHPEPARDWPRAPAKALQLRPRMSGRGGVVLLRAGGQVGQVDHARGDSPRTGRGCWSAPVGGGGGHHIQVDGCRPAHGRAGGRCGCRRSRCGRGHCTARPRCGHQTSFPARPAQQRSGLPVRGSVRGRSSTARPDARCGRRLPAPASRQKRISSWRVPPEQIVQTSSQPMRRAVVDLSILL